MDFVFTILLAFVVVITIYTIILVKNKLDMKDIDCRKNMIKKNTTGTLVPFTTENVSLKDCYIMTAYNCCSVKEDWVDLCALSHCIKLGCRCLDFEIFEHNNNAVVGTTSMKNGIRRDSYNYIKLSKVISKIAKEAFSIDYTELNEDPLIVNLRIKVTTKEFYNKVAYDISGATPSEYKNSQITGDEYVKDLSGIIYMSSDIHELTYQESDISNNLNLIGEKAPTNLSRNYCNGGITISDDIFNVFQVNNTNLMDHENSVDKLSEISNILKISIPDDIKINPNYCYHKKAKINFIGMSFREKIPKDYSLIPWVNLKSDYKEDLLDFEELGNLNNYIKWFYDNGNAFIQMTGDKHKDDDSLGDSQEPTYNSCNSLNAIYGMTDTIVNEGDNTKTKIRKYWYNNIMSKLI
tara:strand:+ start:581 stop:1804 length:1224 start_codon:yes stop_codon:yes gene_type:complete